jgi:tight adherence protein B
MNVEPSAAFAAALASAAVWIAAAPSQAELRLRRLTDRPARPLSAAVVQRAGAAVRELRRRRRRPHERRTAVIELCDGISAELAAGRTPQTALSNAAAVVDSELCDALTAAPGDDVAARLDRVAELPGAEGLRLLAGCWRIGAERGGMFGGVVDGLAGTLRAEQAHRAEVAAQLAGPRATARLLAMLPLLGLAMGAALGAHPLAFLFGTVPGGGCLLAGLGLDALGLWWTRRLVAGAEMSR